MNELLTDELRATLHERFGDVTATPALYERIQRRIARRRRARTLSAVAATVAVLVAIVAVPAWLTPGGLLIDDRPDHLADRSDAAPAVEPTHALFTTTGGGLIGVELASGTRTELVADPGHAAAVIDLTVAAGSTIENFTAIGYDDGAGPIGFVTYLRRDGGEVHTSFTPKDGRLARHSNRGFRTISPDGRWLAYSAVLDDDRGAVGLIPIDPQTGALDIGAQQFIIGLGPPTGWSGPVSNPGDRSMMVHPPAGADRFDATILERTSDGFDIVDTLQLEVEPFADPDGSGMRRLAFGALLPGQPDDTRFDVVIERANVEVGQPLGPDHAIIGYRGPEGSSQLRFEISAPAGNPHLAVQARTALLTIDTPSTNGDPGVDGEAWLIRAITNGDTLTLEPRGPLLQGVVSGALLTAP